MDYKMMLDILFYARKIIPVPTGTENNGMLAMTALRNLSDYGFILDKKGMEMLSTASADDIAEWYYEAAEKFNRLAGGNHVYNPFYPNFPEQVIEATDLELFIDQITHYISFVIEDILGESGQAWMPGGENRKKNIKSLEEHPLKVIETIDAYDEGEIGRLAAEIFQNTLKSKLAPSAEDLRNIINAYISGNEKWTDDATVVENRQVLSYLYTRAVADKADTSKMPPLVTNDYLRIAQYYSWMKNNNSTEVGNLSCIEYREKGKRGEDRKKGRLYRIASIPNSMRRFIAKGLDAQKNLEEDIARNRGVWKVLFKLMHVGTMKECKNLLHVAQKLRNGDTLNTFYSRIERAFAKKDYISAVRMYASRPGEFIKNLNRMMMVKFDDEKALDEYTDVLLEKAGETFAKTRPEDLIRLIGYLNARARDGMLAIHNVKGKLVCTENRYDTLPKETAELFIKLAKESIASQIKTGKPYGKVYIDPMLGNVPLPTEISDVSKAMNSYPRGTRLPIERNEDGTPKNIRVFVWWTNQDKAGGHGNDFVRVDLDLSVNLFKKDGDSPRTQYETSIAYHSDYRYKGDIIVHSGDVTDGKDFGGEGVTEYIDINMKKLQEDGIDYVHTYVNSYTGQAFGTIPHLCGWQEREELDKSAQFDIKAVKQTSTLSKDSRGTTMFIIDVNAGELIWLDAPDQTAHACSNSLDALNNLDTSLERYARGDQMTMKEMAELAVGINGGEIVDAIEDADTVFLMDMADGITEQQRVITAKDQDIWLGEFMSPQETDGNAEADERKESAEDKENS